MCVCVCVCVCKDRQLLIFVFHTNISFAEVDKFLVKFSSVFQSSPTICNPTTTACQASLSIINSQSLLKLMCIELVIPSNHLIFCPRGSKSLLQHHAAAAAKSLQSCPTPCDPIDGNPPGSAVPAILQARTPEWVAISFSNA